ncbi:hypothetical protein VaNZ11_000200 [Volvox africanus]|uniref:Checkpoint protein n=1 Tax=Volvox africanus TaxID=51714 RepID=A0ABQ5RN08_9CHLO|nr:hypothetical protein VaNZ11_000200 [Volvox africanus]
MKLKGKLTEHGARILWKNFLPTIEKFGKTCQVLLGTDDINFIQTSLNTDGVHVTARFAAETLFEVESYRCQSKHFNLIAFQVEVGLLLRVLKGAAATNSEMVEVKLTTRQIPGPAGEAQSKPFLSFTAVGASTTVVQDVPISKPYTALEVQSLVAAKDVGAFCPAYVDVVPALGPAQAIVDRLKTVDDTAMLAVSRGGEAHVLVQTPSVALGAQLRDLPVYPHTAYDPAGGDRLGTGSGHAPDFWLELPMPPLVRPMSCGCITTLKLIPRCTNPTPVLPFNSPSAISCGYSQVQVGQRSAAGSA